MTCSVPHKAKLLFLLTMIFIYTFLWNSHTSSMQVLTKPPFAEARVPHDIAMLRNLISSKMEYPPRKVPEKEEVVKVDPHLSSLIDQQFLPNIKSPCWYEEIANKLVSNPYNSSYFAKHDKVFKDLLTTMNADFKKYLHYSGGKQFRLRCLPYFYIIGQPKCGTTDLFYRLLEHPQLKYNAFKEPHWWNRRRFGGLYGKRNDGNISMESYLDIFDWAARNIEVGLREGPSANNSALKIVTGEASAATMWDSMTSEFESNTREDGPHILTADIIHIAQPDAKFIAIFRDPVERLYSDYLYFHDSIKTVEDFHQKVLDSLKVFEACLSTSSLRCCAYMGYSTPKSLRIYIGMYVIYLLDWLTILDKNQILILRLEDYSANLNETLHRVYNFLGVDPLPKELEERIVERDKANSQKEKISSVGSMLPATRDILKAFYSPFNRKLASVLKNKAFLWP